MFANFFTRRPNPDYEDAFVREVEVARRRPLTRKTATLLKWMWALIVLKSLFVWWACANYPVPFNAWWIIGPSVLFALLCTAVCYMRR